MTVFVVQETMRRDRHSGDLVPAFDVTPASVYGDLEVLIPPGLVMLSTVPMVNKMKKMLMKFNDDDYLLAIGDPSAIAAASAIAASINNGRFKLLKWDRETRSYIAVTINLYGR